MFSVYKGKNSFGGHTMEVPLGNGFFLCIHETKEGFHVSELNEKFWFTSKTHFSMVSLNGLNDAVQSGFRGAFDFFQYHSDYAWTEEAASRKLNEILDAIERAQFKSLFGDTLD